MFKKKVSDACGLEARRIFGLLEASGADFDNIFGDSFESIRSFGATMGDNLGKRAWRSKKSEKMSKNTAWIPHFFYSGSCVFLLRAGGGGASPHLEKTRFRMEGIAFFACAPFCAQREIRELQDKLPTKTRPDGEAKNKRRSIIGKHIN